MRKFQSIIFALALICGANLWANSSANSSDSTKGANQADSQIKAFAMMPPLTVLLEILYPQGMIGLNREFMPQNVANCLSSVCKRAKSRFLRKSSH